MDQVGIICDFLIWLEGYLDQFLLFDNVAVKVGYFKWYLQRMFKDVIGYVIGVYICVCCLLKLVVVLCLIVCLILDIVL